jgi:AcrR family transcriptional regulator
MTRDMIKAEGVDNLSLNKLARALGVKTPSLYRYFNGRIELLKAVNAETDIELQEWLNPSLSINGDAYAKLSEAAWLYRQYALENPNLYGLMFTNTIEGIHEEDYTLNEAAAHYYALMVELTGEEKAQDALRAFFALTHGFVSLEMSGQWREGVVVLGEKYKQAIEAFLSGWRA